MDGDELVGWFGAGVEIGLSSSNSEGIIPMVYYPTGDGAYAILRLLQGRQFVVDGFWIVGHLLFSRKKKTRLVGVESSWRQRERESRAGSGFAGVFKCRINNEDDERERFGRGRDRVAEFARGLAIVFLILLLLLLLLFDVFQQHKRESSSRDGGSLEGKI